MSNNQLHRVKRNDELGRISVVDFKQATKLPISIILDNIRSQHNIGSIFRTADSFIMEKIYLCGICATPPTAEIHKSALGAEFSVDWEYSQNTADIAARLKNEGYVIVSVEQAENSISLNDAARIIWGENNCTNSNLQKIALVFGNEVKGVSQEVVDLSHYVVEIPQFGTKHSLNVSVSAGITLWEFCKAAKLNK